MKITKAANPGFLVTLNGKKGHMTKKKKNNNSPAKKANGKKHHHHHRYGRNPDIKSLPIHAFLALAGALGTRMVSRLIPIQRTQLVDVLVQAGVGIGLGYALAKTKFVSEQNAEFVALGGVAAALSAGITYYFPSLQEQILQGSAIVQPAQTVAPTAAAPAGGVADIVRNARTGAVIGMANIQAFPQQVSRGYQMTA